MTFDFERFRIPRIIKCSTDRKGQTGCGSIVVVVFVVAIFLIIVLILIVIWW